jgi:sortase A
MKTGAARKRASLGAALMIAGGLLVLSALSLFLYNDFDDKRAFASASRIADALVFEIEARADTTPDNAADTAPETAPDAAADAGGESGTITVDGEVYIGVLRIPALGLTLPVARDWSYERLKISPCRYSGSIDEDTMVIAAHNYRRHFGNIRNLSRGDDLTFTDAAGRESRYAVAEIETIEATAVKDMTGSAYDLTLFTCTYGGVARVAVRCEAK